MFACTVKLYTENQVVYKTYKIRNFIEFYKVDSENSVSAWKNQRTAKNMPFWALFRSKKIFLHEMAMFVSFATSKNARAWLKQIPTIYFFLYWMHKHVFKPLPLTGNNKQEAGQTFIANNLLGPTAARKVMLTTCHPRTWTRISKFSAVDYFQEEDVILKCSVYLHSARVFFDGQDSHKGWISFSWRFLRYREREKKIAATHACNVTFGMSANIASWKFNSTPFVTNEFTVKDVAAPPLFYISDSKILEYFFSYPIYTIFAPFRPSVFIFTVFLTFLPNTVKNFYQKQVTEKKFFSPPLQLSSSVEIQSHGNNENNGGLISTKTRKEKRG